MAPKTSLPSLLPARAVVCRGCLRALPSYTQKRMVGTKYLEKVRLAEKQWKAQAAEIAAGTRKNLFDEFEDRGLVKDLVGTKKNIRETMRLKRIGAYAGVDPTAPSLHLGHLLPFMPLFWMYMHGYTAITVIGGSTAKIGDPTGRSDARPELSRGDLVQNLATIHYQLITIWKHVEQASRRFGYEKEWVWRRGIVNNNAWWNKMPMLDVVKQLGSQMRMGPLLSRDTVKTRLDDGTGMSFAEFCYPLMQAWDWFELLKQRGTQLQIGGSDQYGNILTGASCVKACIANEPHPEEQLPHGPLDQPIGFTVPLLTDSAGVKFGKSAGNALWLDPFKTTPYDLYGYLVRRADNEVEKLLKLFTFHPLEAISQVMKEHELDPPKRVAQHLLAYEVVWLVHGEKVAIETQEKHRMVYGARKSPTTDEAIPQQTEHFQATGAQVNVDNRPRVDMKLPIRVAGLTLPRIVYAAGLSESVGDGDRIIKNGGIYIGGSPGQKSASNVGMRLDQLQFTPARTWKIEDNANFLIDGKILLLRKGKHNIRCIEFISDEEWDNSGWEYPGQPLTGKFRKAMAQLREMHKTKAAHDGDAAPGTGPETGSFLPSSQKLLQMTESNFKRVIKQQKELEEPTEKKISDNSDWAKPKRELADGSEW
ncbi:Tyrosine--tRNA ligase, mitochondrial [Cytospora mali]|uniref:Tyrosine--tRNA ligase n=1 Tax=Cytospora mali TaxID=578113 RepID=A0A194W1Z5_CYTMA|nr:Tyrosine--tRNA ligase, mitochondrial [Valsa mali]